MAVAAAFRGGMVPADDTSSNEAPQLGIGQADRSASIGNGYGQDDDDLCCYLLVMCNAKKTRVFRNSLTIHMCKEKSGQ